MTKLSKLVLVDVDGTICFTSPPTEERFLCVSNGYFLSLKTLALLEKISQMAILALVTGRRLVNALSLATVPADYVICEHGGLIYNKQQVFDQDWSTHHQPFVTKLLERKGQLWDFEQRLASQGVKTDKAGRYVSFRVLSPLDDQETSLASGRVIDQLPTGLTSLVNQGQLDILPLTATKDRAIGYLAERFHCPLSQVVMIGDDANDLAALNLVGWPMTLAGASRPVVEAVKSRGGMVSSASDHAGIQQLLRCLIHQLTC